MDRRLRLTVNYNPGLGLHPARWRVVDDPAQFLDIAAYIDIARRAEAAGFDAVFLSDFQSLPIEPPFEPWHGLDPLLALASIAVQTEQIGLIATVSTTLHEPYDIARRFSSLDHISHGRAGWNIVTSFLPLSGQNFGIDLPDHRTRYERAEEFVEVANKLWGSWPEGAFLRDVANGRFVDWDKVRVAHHTGTHFNVRGPLQVPPGPQVRPVIMQAGASQVRVDGGYRLSGTKNYTTGALGADWIYVSGRDEGGAVRSAIIPTQRDGVEIRDDFDGIGQRATGSGSVQLNGVHLADAEISPPLAFDHPPVRYRATFGQLYLVGVLAGIGQAALADATAYVKGRARPAQHALHQQPADDPVIQTRLGAIAALVWGATATALSAAAAQQRVFEHLLAQEAGSDTLLRDLAVEVAQAHVAVSAAVLDAANQVFALGSGSAVLRGEALDRHWRNARTVSNHSPLDYKCQVIGEALLKGATPPTNGYF